ncbi:MAG: sulfurtransferase complex subunit TusB [SAR324 cluster bacterium]|nr:sulfurtransferase complex subunit TusB [SAR324 cluster bacterium]
MLHTINKSPFSADSFDTCLKFAQEGDPILLIEDGVYAAQCSSKVSGQLAQHSATNDFYALSSDLKARGISVLCDQVKVIDYAGFVELAEKHQVNSWL